MLPLITYKKSESTQLIGYSDADCAGDLDERHSTSGNIFLMRGGAANLLSKKNVVNSYLSTAESEYIALSTATQELAWLRKLLKDFGDTRDQATVVMENNQGAICITKNPEVPNILIQSLKLQLTIGHFPTNFRIWPNKNDFLGQIYCIFAIEKLLIFSFF